jgi:uncharacterized membrane-anchored protein YhcB (DUF1043 family)
MFILGLVIGLVVGIIAGGYIVKNNKDKAFDLLDRLRLAAEAEASKAKSELEEIRNGRLKP